MNEGKGGGNNAQKISSDLTRSFQDFTTAYAYVALGVR